MRLEDAGTRDRVLGAALPSLVLDPGRNAKEVLSRLQRSRVFV
jgi:hypothetical protein